MIVEKIKQRKQWVHIIILLTVLIGATISAVFIGSKLLAPKLSDEVIQVVKKKSPEPATISSNVLFTGNIFWGRYINDWASASELGFAYPFSRLNEFNRSEYNAWISGLECPIVSGINISSADMDATLAFNCSPDYLPEASKWFTAVSLANNHTDNQGSEGFEQTKQHLDTNNIQYFGHYDYQNINDVCEVISLPVTTKLDDNSTINGYLPVAMCGYHGVFGIPVSQAVNEIAKYSPYMPVIAMPHMGAEYKPAPDDIKINFYHSLIDGGADMVLGDHPHVIQNTESYNGHLIVYSMGNFIFDQQDSVDVTRSAAIKVVMNTTDSDSALLKKWLAIGKNCATFKDDCLAQIQTQNLEKLAINYQFAVVGSNDADRIAKPATAEQQASILERLNWQSTINQLTAPYSGL